MQVIEEQRSQELTCEVCHRPLCNPQSEVRNMTFCGEFSVTPLFADFVDKVKKEVDGAKHDALLARERVGPCGRVTFSRAYYELIDEANILKRLMSHCDFGKVGYRKRDARVCVCAECYNSTVNGRWAEGLALLKEGWVLESEPSQEDISAAIDKMIVRVIPDWGGFDDFKKRQEKRREADSRSKIQLSPPRKPGCLLPLIAIISTLVMFCTVAVCHG